MAESAAGSADKQLARDDFKKKREAFMPQMESQNDLKALKMREFAQQKEGKDEGAPREASGDRRATIPEEQLASNSTSR